MAVAKSSPPPPPSQIPPDSTYTQCNDMYLHASILTTRQHAAPELPRAQTSRPALVPMHTHTNNRRLRRPPNPATPPQRQRPCPSNQPTNQPTNSNKKSDLSSPPHRPGAQPAHRASSSSVGKQDHDIRRRRDGTGQDKTRAFLLERPENLSRRRTRARVPKGGGESLRVVFAAPCLDLLVARRVGEAGETARHIGWGGIGR